MNGWQVAWVVVASLAGVFSLWANFRLHKCVWCNGTGRNIFHPDHPCSICEGRGKKRM